MPLSSKLYHLVSLFFLQTYCGCFCFATHYRRIRLACMEFLKLVMIASMAARPVA
ncbi:MAG: hypothetical protein ACE5HS_12245 [bacterium]